MDITPLEDLGLTQNEAKTYVTLLQSGTMSAGQLAKRVDLHRSRIYECLDRLTKKGLIKFISINNIKYFQSEPPLKLLDILEDLQERIKNLIPLLESYKENPDTIQKISAFNGVGGIKNLLKETLNTKEYIVFGAPEESTNILGNAFWKNYNIKKEDLGIKTKMIFNESLRYWLPIIKKINPTAKIRFLEKQFDNLTETFVFDNKVIIITWTKEPLGIFIIDDTIAKTYKKFFDVMWKKGKE